jgi:hypothetical protein
MYIIYRFWYNVNIIARVSQFLMYCFCRKPQWWRKHHPSIILQTLFGILFLGSSTYILSCLVSFCEFCCQNLHGKSWNWNPGKNYPADSQRRSQKSTQQSKPSVALGCTNTNVENQWFSKEKDRQTVGFPHIL